MDIRQSRSDERDAIKALHLDAFGEEEAAEVVQLAYDLVSLDSAPPVLSLVACEGERLLGNGIFSPVHVAGSAPGTVYILSPLAVATSAQRGGIGTGLMREGFKVLESQGVQLVMVLGDPRYYTRAGFASGHSIKAPYEIPYPEAWLARELAPGALSAVAGTAVCVEPLQSPDLW